LQFIVCNIRDEFVNRRNLESKNRIMMKVSAFTALMLLGLDICVDAFQPIRSKSTTTVMRSSRADLSEFDFILGETDSSQQQTIVRSRRKIQLSGDDSRGDRVTVLASTAAGTFAAPGAAEEIVASEEEEVDPYADILEESSAVSRYEQKDESFMERTSNKFKDMDMQDIISTLIVPSIFAFAGLRWSARKAAGKVTGKADDTLDTFANEMVYHDGDFEELKLCMNVYNKKLVWLGPNKSKAMLKSYLRLYCKKRIVSPQAISSLSYVFSLFKLTEEKASKILVSICQDMGIDGLSTAQKLLFFGTRILKSDEGHAALDPIREIIKSSYRGEGTIPDMMLETSQQAMAENAYKTAVINAGKEQTSLTTGWEVLGLDKETATEIYNEEAKGGFISEREKLYGGQSQKYDEKGNKVDKEGNLVDPENAIGDDEPEMPASNVMECMECSYTLFIAKGREAKFFGDNFKCPECGAGKDRFEPKDIQD